MLGVLNHRTASNLGSLPCGEQLHYEAFMDSSTKLEETMDSYLNGNKKVQFDIVINIMGPVSNSEAVGQQLSERRLFLQRPYQLPEGTVYSNPQYLDMEETFEESLEGDFIEGGEASKTHSLDGNQLSAQDDLEGELWSIIDNSPLPQEMTRIEIDQRIHTTLMEYVLYSSQDCVPAGVSELTSISQTPTRCCGLHYHQRKQNCNQMSRTLDGRTHR